MNSSVRAFRRKRDYIASKPNILIKVFDQLFAGLPAGRGDFYDRINLEAHYMLSFNPNVTWDFIKKHPAIKWMTRDLSACPNITWNIIKENLYADYWDWDGVSSNPNITWDIVKTNPLMPWNMSVISINNPSIVWNDIREYQTINRNTGLFATYELLHNQSITPEIIGSDPVFAGGRVAAEIISHENQTLHLIIYLIFYIMMML